MEASRVDPPSADGHVHAVITHRELRNNSGEVLRRVAAGESIDITNHGKVVATLCPPRDETPLEESRRLGRTRPATTPMSRLHEIKRVKLDITTAELLDDARGRW